MKKYKNSLIMSVGIIFIILAVTLFLTTAKIKIPLTFFGFLFNIFPFLLLLVCGLLLCVRSFRNIKLKKQNETFIEQGSVIKTISNIIGVLILIGLFFFVMVLLIVGSSW
jgi:hypothetical protein